LLWIEAKGEAKARGTAKAKGEAKGKELGIEYSLGSVSQAFKSVTSNCGNGIAIILQHFPPHFYDFFTTAGYGYTRRRWLYVKLSTVLGLNVIA